MKLIMSGNRYILQCAFSEKDVAKSAGMRWHPADRVWATTDSAIAEMLLQYADGSVKAAIVASKAIIAQQITASRATDVSIDVPCPEGLAYLGFQKAGIVYCLRRFGVDLSAIPLYNGDRKGGNNANGNIPENDGHERTGAASSCIVPVTRSTGESKGQTHDSGTGRGLEEEGIGGDVSANARSRCEAETSCGTETGERTVWGELLRRQRADNNSESGGDSSPINNAGGNCGISGQDQRTRNATQDPDVLQSGCGISEAENSSRNRRAESPPVETARERPKENGSLAGARMAGTQDKTQIEKGGQYPSRGVLIADEMG